MKKYVLTTIAVGLAVMLLVPGLSFAGKKFGIIFDVKGNVVMYDSKGNSQKLKRSRHILKPVSVGDRIEIDGAGRILIVSIDKKMGYELQSNSSAMIEAGGIKTLKGTIDEKEGFNVPLAGNRGAIGATVLRSSMRKPCLRTIYPLNTTVETLTPKLKWEYSCKDKKSVFIKVIEGRKIIFEAKAEGQTINLPKNILKYGTTYRWLVDGGSKGIIGGAFSTIQEDTKKELDERSKQIAVYRKDMSERLSYIFFLLENDIKHLAQAEVESLQKDFPDNTFMKQMH
jgi:hypothetical protein